MYVHSKMTDLGFLPCEEDAATAATATAATGAARAKPGDLIMLSGGQIARVIYSPAEQEGVDGWSCTYTRPEWRVFAPLQQQQQQHQQQQQQQQQLIAGRRLRLSLGRVGGRAVLRADDSTINHSAVLLELPHDLAADTAAAAATAAATAAAEEIPDPLSQFDTEKLQVRLGFRNI